MTSDNRPPVSVVISTFNRAAKLKRALKSVLDQTYRDFEVIVVDNASDDGSEETVKGFEDPRIIYIKLKENRGAPTARNTGINTAKGEYIALLDDDDQWFPEKLAEQMERMIHGDERTGVIYTGWEIFDETKNVAERIHQPRYKGDVYNRLLKSSILGGVSSALIKRKCFEEVGLFDEALTSCQDWDMWLRIARRYDFDYVPDVLTRINFHGKQISTDYRALIPGRTRMVEKHWKEFEQFPRILTIHLKRLGKMHCINGTWRESIFWFRKAVAIRPLEIVKIAAWCLLQWPMVKYFSREKDFNRYQLK